MYAVKAVYDSNNFKLKEQYEVEFEEKYKDNVLNIEYTATVREIEDGWYMAQCEQIQGVLTQGRTIDEAKENLKDAICLLEYQK
jgi:hypothetical protein